MLVLLKLVYSKQPAVAHEKVSHTISEPQWPVISFSGTLAENMREVPVALKE